MLDIFNSIRSFLKLDQVCIDNFVFRLHYKVTVIILVISSLFVTSNQYFGDPIDCIMDDVPSRIIDTYCWIHSTYTVSNRIGGKIGRDFIQPGVTNYNVNSKDEIKYHRYYQWVCFVLFFQAILFYVPRYLWKTWENGRIKMLTLNLNDSIVNPEYRGEKRAIIVEYLRENRGYHNFYAIRFFICELLNIINVIGQIFLVDYFLDGEFSTYGIKVLQFTELNPDMRSDPMSRIFPKVTKCSFNQYGPSGSVQTFDGLCVLPLNVINEKIYIVLWFWFVILSILSLLGIVYRLIILFVPKTRYFILCFRTKMSLRHQIKDLLSVCQIGDWFILYLISKNTDSIIFREIIRDLDYKLNEDVPDCFVRRNLKENQQPQL